MLRLLRLIDEGSIASDKIVSGNKIEANSTDPICMMARPQTREGLC